MVENDPAATKLSDEIATWQRFADALRADDREAFKEMLNQAFSYSQAFVEARKPNATEVLFISILLGQHKTIHWLSRILRHSKNETEL